MRRVGRHRRGKQKKILIIGSLSLLLFLSVGYAAFSTNLSITAKGNIKEKSRVIQAWNANSQTDFHSDFYKQNILNVTFLDNNNISSNAVESWNVSEDKKNGGVMAWVVPNNKDNTKYDLYIGAKGGVIANEDSSCLFYEFINLFSINFNNNFDTSMVINMSYMFYHCTNLEVLDLIDFNTSNVTNMSDFISAGNNLTSINLSNFDTKNVTNMSHMFSSWYKKEPEVFQGSKLKSIIFGNNFSTINVTDMADMFSGLPLESLDLSNFNTKKVTNMYHMFRGCNNLTSLNLCSFDTSHVINMEGMFSNNNLQIIYVGPNWTTVNADITDMFFGSTASSVTTGHC